MIFDGKPISIRKSDRIQEDFENSSFENISELDSKLPSVPMSDNDYFREDENKMQCVGVEFDPEIIFSKKCVCATK